MATQPDSKILNQLDTHWQKMAMLILWKLNGDKTVTITTEDIEKFTTESEARGGFTLFTHGHETSIDFQVVDKQGVENIRRLAQSTGEDLQTRKTH